MHSNCDVFFVSLLSLSLLYRFHGANRAYAQRCVCTTLPNQWDTGACLINDVQSINLWPIYSESTTTNRATAKCDNNGPSQQQTNKEREGGKEPQQFCAIWQQFLCIYHTRRPSGFWLMMAKLFALVLGQNWIKICQKYVIKFLRKLR